MLGFLTLILTQPRAYRAVGRLDGDLVRVRVRVRFRVTVGLGLGLRLGLELGLGLCLGLGVVLLGLFGLKAVVLVSGSGLRLGLV